MSKFRKGGKKSQPGISTASLPDIVFMLLFFFMVTTVMREVDLLVEVNKPDATEVEKLEKKSLVDYIYIGRPTAKELGDQPRIQLDDAFATAEQIRMWKEKCLDNRPAGDRNKVTTSFKVDKEVEMGLVTDCKQELREGNFLKINYSAMERVAR